MFKLYYNTMRQDVKRYNRVPRRFYNILTHIIIFILV